MDESSSLRHEPLVVVFGGAGYIGSYLTRLLLAEGFRVRVFDNFLFGDRGLENLESPLLEVIEGDICDTRAVSAATKGAEIVILLAAIVGHRTEDVKWRNTRSINFLASTTVLDAALEHGVSRFLFASTNSVYGIQKGVLYETSIPEPASLYSRLKLRMEERVIAAKNRHFHPTSLRLATCHGYSPRMRFDLVLNSLIRDAVLEREINIESGEQYRALIHVEDAARAFVSCIRAHENLISGEIFNVGASDQSVQVNHLANLVRAAVPEVTVNVLEGEPDLVDYRLSCTKIEKVLDFKTEWSLEASIEQICEALSSGILGDPYSLKYHNT